MSETTKIQWADSTFNPWIGCTKVSTADAGGGGCDGCYAAESTPVRIMRAAGRETWGPGAPRHRTSAANWNQVLRWNARPFLSCPECGWRGDRPGSIGDVAVCPQVKCAAFLRLARRRVFCASLADVFDNEVDAAWRADLFALIADTPNLDWLLLTKRIGNAGRMIVSAMLDLAETDRQGRTPSQPWPWPNVWLGATVVNQLEADRDLPKLLRTPAAVRFLSIEPMLGPIDLVEAVSCPDCRGAGFGCDGPEEIACSTCEGHEAGPIDLGESGIDWVITGGESGPHARPANPQWFRDIRDQCAAAGVAHLHKQNGEFASVSEVAGEGAHHTFEDGRTVRRVGKKAASRLLDGVVHNGFPGVRHG